jgi:hypothetical protein
MAFICGRRFGWRGGVAQLSRFFLNSPYRGIPEISN